MNTKKAQANNSVCAVCGFRHLASPQRTTSGGASHEICPACGFEPGFSDDVQGLSYEQWRATWVTSGLQWFSKGVAKPKDWNPMREIHSLLRRKRPVISARILAQVAAAKTAALEGNPIPVKEPQNAGGKEPHEISADKRIAS